MLLASTTTRDIPGAIQGLVIALGVIGFPAVFAIVYSLRWAWHESACWIIAVSSRWWPGVQGEVVRSRVEVHGLPDGADLKILFSRPNWNRRQSVEFETRFLYRYVVRGRQHEGSRIECYSFLDFGKYSESSTRDRLIGLEQGRQVTVYYNPLWPSCSLLRRDLPSLYVAVVSYFFAIPLLFFGSVGMVAIAGFMTERCLRDLGLLK